MPEQTIRTDAGDARTKGRAKANFHKTVSYVAMRLGLSFPARALLRELVDLSYEHPRGWYATVSNRRLTFALGYRRDSSVRRILQELDSTTAGLLERQSGKGKGRKLANVDTLYIFDLPAWQTREVGERDAQREEIREQVPAGEDSGFGWAHCAPTPERASAPTPERASALTPERASALTIQGSKQSNPQELRKEASRKPEPSASLGGDACLPPNVRAALIHYGVAGPIMEQLAAVDGITVEIVVQEWLQIQHQSTRPRRKPIVDPSSVLMGSLCRRFGVEIKPRGSIGQILTAERKSILADNAALMKMRRAAQADADRRTR